MIRVLIVDDHHLFGAGLAAIIQQEPDIQVVDIAGTVAEGVDAVDAHMPDIVLMDFNLPDGSGAEATRLILARHPACKVVFLSMSEKEDDLIAAIRSGAVGYLLKNMKPARLIATLRAVQNGESALSNAMTLTLMKELSRRPSAETPSQAALKALTAREQEIFAHLAAGKSNQEIALALHISDNTVKYHVHSILTKLDLKDRKDAARFFNTGG
jgi:DNA-binding NarL/FixJ family response regulator